MRRECRDPTLPRFNPLLGLATISQKIRWLAERLLVVRLTWIVWATAALTFLVAGGVSSIPAAIAVYALARAPAFLLYIARALTGSFAAGPIFQAIQ